MMKLINLTMFINHYIIKSPERDDEQWYWLCKATMHMIKTKNGPSIRADIYTACARNTESGTFTFNSVFFRVLEDQILKYILITNIQ